MALSKGSRLPPCRVTSNTAKDLHNVFADVTKFTFSNNPLRPTTFNGYPDRNAITYPESLLCPVAPPPPQVFPDPIGSNSLRQQEQKEYLPCNILDST